MTAPDHYGHGTENSRRLYRDSDKGLALGVCAGVADYFGFDITTTRVCAAVSLIFFMPATLLVYFGLALLLPKRLNDSGEPSRADSPLQRAVRAEPHGTLSTVSFRFRELETRLQRLEKYVTSPRFQLDQEFETLRD